MIIFGHRAKFVKSVPLPAEKCSNCSTDGMMEFHFYQRYFHIFWIPVFPLDKIVYAVCGHCKHTLEKKEMPEFLKGQIDRAKDEVSAPWYTYIGLVVIVVAIIVAAVQTRTEKKSTEQYLSAPQVHDLYVLKDKEGYYHMQLTEIEGDAYVFALGEYFYTYASDAEKADITEAGFFATDTIALTKEALESLYQEKQISRIMRK